MARPVSMTKEMFVEKANKVHNNKCDYSESVYVNLKTTIKIYCLIHNTYFYQIPFTHLRGRCSCPKCKTETQYKTQRINPNVFIIKASKKHGELIDYSNSVYINTNIKVTFRCKKHNAFFSQLPLAHIRAQYPCPKCFSEHMKICSTKKSEEEQRIFYLKRLKILLKKVIRCRKIVSKRISLTTEQFINKAKVIHHNKYDYSKTIFITMDKKVIIGCPVNNHGYFEQKAASHLTGYGCTKCKFELASRRYRKPLKELMEQIKKVHGDKYKYPIEFTYKNLHDKINIECSIHGTFKQELNVHIHGGGCPSCLDSKGELAIKTWLLKNNINFKMEHTFPDCKLVNKLMFDFYLPDYNAIIEYDGLQHFKSIAWFGGDAALASSKYRDEIKNKYCANNNIILLRIPYKKLKKIPYVLYKFFKKLNPLFKDININNLLF